MNIKNFISQRKFIKHNKRIFSEIKNKKKNKKNYNFLIEFNAFHHHHIALSHVIAFFRENYNCSFFSYPSHALLNYPIQNNFFKKIKIFILKIFNLGNYGIYKSFGITNFIDLKISNKIKNKATVLLKKIKIKDKDDVINLKVNNILIGDLIYDTYLKKYRIDIPTIDVKSPLFLNFLKEFIELFFLWKEIIIRNKVNSFVISHTEYSIGLPARICIFRGGEGFLMEYDRFTKINKKNIYHFSASTHYKKNFLKFSEIQRKKFFDIGKKNLIQRLRGSIKDIPYMTKSAYASNKKFNFKSTNYNFKNKKTKILIATHDFVDAPHNNGQFIFPDMVEWIRFLANLSKKSNYVWYIKNHPAMNDKWKSYQIYTRQVVNRLIKDSKIILLDSNISHNKIIKEIKIDCVLTVWGRIAHEYAFRNVPVINASKNNIHSSFNFNFHARNINHYIYLIKNFKKIKKRLNFDEVSKFYFMHYIYSDKNWFFEDFDKFIKEIKGYHNLWSREVYNQWIKNYHFDFKRKFDTKLDNFINSDSLILSKDEYTF